MGTEHLSGRVKVWRTSGDQTRLLERSTVAAKSFDNARADLKLSGTKPSTTLAHIDPRQRHQTMQGFGAALTDASAYNLWHRLAPGVRDNVMAELFGSDGINLSLLRLPVGASDFSTARYTYDDRRWPRRDRNLAHFSIARDEAYVLPLLRQARDLNPSLSIIASPWSAPAWMKRWRRLNGGRLKSHYYGCYARYLVRFVEAYAAAGIPIYALTPQNEPGHATGGYPSMPLAPAEQAALTLEIRAALSAAGLTTKLLVHDHNWSDDDKVFELLARPGVPAAVNGVAWHGYGGEPSAQSRVASAYPNLETHFTEITGSQGFDFAGDLSWGIHNIMIGTTFNQSRSVLYWNLALDDRNGPRSGGYAQGRGVITTHDDGTITRNVEYYTLAHLSKFVAPGAVRIGCTFSDEAVEGVAFENPDTSRVILLHNASQDSRSVTVDDEAKRYVLTVGAHEVVTSIWSAR